MRTIKRFAQLWCAAVLLGCIGLLIAKCIDDTDFMLSMLFCVFALFTGLCVAIATDDEI
jgi:hypothetical protein